MKKDTLTNIILFVIFFAGLSLLLYPTVSDYINSLSQTQAVAEYVELVAELDNEHYDAMIREALDYNRELQSRETLYELNEEEAEYYNSLLNLTGSGIMGYVEVPAIGVTLPIYHGTSNAVLSVAIGHLEWTSLPVGGSGSHCVISGHRGLPSARLFTDLDKIVEGDVFYLQILDETLTYEVDQILIVEPADVGELGILPEEDLVTLVTCTPYGINSHRLLVRGHRIATVEAVNKTHRVTADAMLLEPVVVAPIVALPILLLLLVALLVTTRKRR